MIKVLVVEDQAIVRSALAALLDLESNIEVVAEAAHGIAALDICKNTAVDIILSDIEMPEMDGLTLALEVKQRYPQIKVMILTTFSKTGYIKRSQSANVAAYLLKDSPSESLVAAINSVHDGNVVIAPELMSQVWRANIDPLTAREREILVYAQSGCSNRAIALKLHLSAGTVRNYIHSACQKLNAQNRIEAANIAQNMGWL